MNLRDPDARVGRRIDFVGRRIDEHADRRHGRRQRRDDLRTRSSGVRADCSATARTPGTRRPSAAACSASSRRVMPQILMAVMPHLADASTGKWRLERFDQSGQRRTGIRLDHEALAHQERAIAERLHRLQVGARLQAALADADHSARAAWPPTSRDASRSTCSVRRLRLLTPMIVAPHRHRARGTRRRCALRPARPARVAAARDSAASARSSSAATISRIASAPAARASSSWYSSTMKSLRSSGILTAARTASRCAERAVEKSRLGQHRNRRGAGALVAQRRSRPDRRPSAARRATAIAACTRRSR